MKPKGKFFSLLPGMRWVPHDIPSDEPSASKPKTRNPFSLRSSAPDYTTLRPRKSTISLTMEPDSELDARTHAQGQSMFFGRLPIELRRMVYEYVMCEEIVHLTLSTKRKFGHFICDSTEGGEEVNDRECGCRVLVGGRKGIRLGSGGERMVRVCRRMYVRLFVLCHFNHGGTCNSKCGAMSHQLD
jgi:hypothetical protein